ncbi:MAG: GerMN domain-containing protein [Oscillospiraceae bacterium]
MKKRLPPILLALALLLCSCGKNGGSGSGSTVSIYRVLAPEYQTSGELLRAEKISLSPTDIPLDAAIAALSAPPHDEKLQSALPDSVKILSAVQERNSIRVNLSPAYKNLGGMTKTLVDYCITLTLCSLEGVDFVLTYVGGELIENKLSSESVILRNTVINSGEGQIRLYFPKTTGGLGSEYREINLNADNSAERAIMDELLKGPRSELLLPSLPEETVLLSIYTQDGICSVSLSSDFMADEASPQESKLAIYSIVNSLVSLASVDGVQILIGGKTTETLGGVDISRPLSENTEIIGSAVAQ